MNNLLLNSYFIFQKQQSGSLEGLDVLWLARPHLADSNNITTIKWYGKLVHNSSRGVSVLVGYALVHVDSKRVWKRCVLKLIRLRGEHGAAEVRCDR